MSQGKHGSQYEKLLAGTPQSAQHADVGGREDRDEGGRGSNGKMIGMGLRGGQLSLSGPQRHALASMMGPRDLYTGSDSPALRGSQINAENKAFQGQQQAQYNLSTSSKAYGNHPKQTQPGAASSSALRTQSTGQGQAHRPEMQSATAVMSRRKQGGESHLQGESGATSSTHPKMSSTLGKQDAKREELDGPQSSSGSPKSKLGAMGRETQNLFAMSGQKSDEDEGDLDQFQSTRALRNRKLLGSDEIENDIESRGEGSSPSKQLKKNSFNLKEHSKFDMFHRNGRSIQELNVLKGADGEAQDITARSFDEEAQPAFERSGLGEANAPGQSRAQNNLSSKDDLKHRSMLLTPKSLGAFAGLQDVRDQRHQSVNATPHGSGPVHKQIQAQGPGKLSKTGAGSEWTAGGARELIIEYENTEQKEQKAKGERMREIIERQMNAEYQNSVNKIMDGAQMNQLGVGAQKSGPAQRGKRTTRQTTAAQLNKHLGGAQEDHVRGFEEDDGILLRQQHQSFNLPSRENEVGSFVNSGAISMKNQASSLAGGSHLQPGEQEDLNGFYANDRAEDASVLVVASGARGKYPASRRSQYSNASVLGRDASLTHPEGRPTRLDSGACGDQLAGRPPVAASSKLKEQARMAKQPGQDSRGYTDYRLDGTAKSSNTSLAYSQQDQEEEIILDQDDVDKQDAAFALLRGQRAPGGRALMYGAGYKAFDAAKQGPKARSAAFLAPEHGKSKGQPSQPLGGRRESRQSSARRSEPRGAQAPESYKNGQLAQKMMAGGIGSLDGSDFSLGRENRHDADVSSFNGLETVQLGNLGPARGHGPHAKVQSFPIKSRHMFAKGQARMEEEAAELRGSKELDGEPSDAEDGGERAPLSMNSKQNSANQASAEKATRAQGNERISRDNMTRKPKPTSISGFLSLPDNRKKNDERRGRPRGYDRIDDDEEQAALADQESPRSVLDVDQIVGHLADSIGEKSAATAQQLPASQRRRPQHLDSSQSPHVANGLAAEVLEGPRCRPGDERVEEGIFYAGYAGLGFHVSNDASTAEPHLLSKPAVGLSQEEASHISASSAKAPALKHSAVNVLQKNLSQSNGPQNSSYYKSDDLISSKQLDEQIVSCEQHLESLRQLKREMMIQAKADQAQNKIYLHGRTQSTQRIGRAKEGSPEVQASDEEAAKALRMSANSMRRAIGDSAAKKQRTFKLAGSGGERMDSNTGDASQHSDLKMPKVSKRSTQKLPSDDVDVVSPGLDSPRPPLLEQQFSLGDQQDMRLQPRQLLVEDVPVGSHGAGAVDSSRVPGLGEGSQVNKPLPVAQMAPSFAQKRIESLSRHQKPTSPPPSMQVGHGLVGSPRDLPASGPFEAGKPENQGCFLQTGRASHERGGIRQSSKHEAIKLEKREKLFKEQLIRHFNQKLVDKVVSALKARAAEELGYVEEEHEAAEDDSNQPLSDKADPEQAQRAKDAVALGRFLFEAKGLDKQLAGQYFGEDKKFNQAVCREFLRCFNFRNLSIDSCWRLIFNKMGLPKEGQQIVRIMSIFQDVYLEKNPDRLKWPKDTVWLVSVKLMDLNTNLHNPNVKPMLRYSRETFVQQSMLIPELKAAFSAEKIADMYDRIAKQEFQSNVNLHEKYFKRINELSYTLVQQSMKSGLKKSGKGASGWQGHRRTINLKRSTLHDAASERNTQLLKTEGTIFTKYGRYGAPKQRLVYLNEDETAICWRDRINKQEKPRKLLIKDVRSVLIGADHTEVMRKQKIPAQFDYQYISILATNRSLDLSIDDKATIHLWCEKISRLLEARQARAQKSLYEASPEVASPHLGQHSEAEVQIHTKDACPGSLVYLWKCELLNNLQNYWNPLSKEIYVDQEIKFDEPGLKQAILVLMEQQGGPFLVLAEQDRRSQSPSYFRNFSSNQQSRAAGGQGPAGNDRPVPKNAGAGSIACGLGQKFSKWASASKPEPQPLAPQPVGPKVNKFFRIFGRRESPITLVQTWYLGLPNIARYCLWPILIGNQLGLNKSIFESLLAQVKSVRRKAAIQKTLEAGSAKQREGYAGRLSIGSAEGSGTAPAQEQGGITNSAQFKRASNLSMIVSENEKELSAEQYSVFDHAPAQHKEIEDSLPKTRRVISGSNDTHDGGLDPVSHGRPSTADVLVGQHLDPFSEHMLAQFNKIQRKVAKLAAHWEKASVIGDLADIPVAPFQQLMNDVLCAFLLHRASINGLQSNMSDLSHCNTAQSALYLQRLEQSAIFISGLEKILAPLVLVHLREQHSFEPQLLQRTAEQVFCCFTNLVLSTGGGSASQDQLFFLKHFITDDFSQIEWRMDFFDKLFGLAEPLLHGQFQGIDLKNEYFLHGWMMAMFGNVQGLEGIEFVLRIWDLYLLHGEAVIYCVALAILKSKLHKLNNAPMQNWQDFFHKIKRLKLPQQSLHYPIGNLAPFQSPNISQQSNQPGTGGSNSNEAEEQSHPSHALGQSDFITNHDSHLMASLIRESLSIFVAYNVPSLFKAHKMQQLVAEQKHEIFTKMYLNDDFSQ